MKRRSKHVQQRPSLPFVEASAITKVSGLSPWARNWLVEQKDSALLIIDFDNFGASLTGSWVFWIVAG